MPSDIKYEYATEVHMSKFLQKEKDFVFHCYDFGDNREHIVTLEKILPREKNVRYPVCVGGALACPPEDCGSIPGYYDCIATVRKKDNEELLEWLGDWDPEAFDPKSVKFELPSERMRRALSK